MSARDDFTLMDKSIRLDKSIVLAEWDMIVFFQIGNVQRGYRLDLPPSDWFAGFCFFVEAVLVG